MKMKQVKEKSKEKFIRHGTPEQRDAKIMDKFLGILNAICGATNFWFAGQTPDKISLNLCVGFMSIFVVIIDYYTGEIK